MEGRDLMGDPVYDHRWLYALSSFWFADGEILDLQANQACHNDISRVF